MAMTEESASSKKKPSEEEQNVKDENNKEGDYFDFSRSDFRNSIVIVKSQVSASTKDFQDVFVDYCTYLANSINFAPLHGIFFDSSKFESNINDRKLHDIYINLDTNIQVEDETAKKIQEAYKKAVDTEKKLEKIDKGLDLGVSFKYPVGKNKFAKHPPESKKRTLTVVEAFVKNRRMVLLGKPGSGKSTFVNMLGYVLCRNRTEPLKRSLQYLPGWPDKEITLLPILIVLREFIQTLEIKEHEDAKPSHLWDFIKAQLNPTKLENFDDHLKSELSHGNCLLLLDGLDEVQPDQRAFVNKAISEFLSLYDKNRILVTCRSLSYPSDYPIKIGNDPLPVVKIAPLDEDKINKFIDNWYDVVKGLSKEFSEEEITTKKKSLKDAIKPKRPDAVEQKRPEFEYFAENPLLLTLMALIHTYRGRLPDTRTLLYEETVDILFWRWDKDTKFGDKKNSSQLHKLLIETGHTIDDLKNVLWKLAYDSLMGKNDGNAPFEIEESELRDALEKLAPILKTTGDPDWNWVQRCIKTIQVRTGLLEKEKKVFKFPHRTFEEYLAGAYLASQKNLSELDIPLDKKELWRDVILLAAGRLTHVLEDGGKCLELIGELCLPKAEDDQYLVWEKASLAGDIFVEIGVNLFEKSSYFNLLRDPIHKSLKEIVENGGLTSQERVRAGNAFFVLGDTRFRGKEKWFLPENPSPLGFVRIPAGKFWMGSDPDKNNMNLYSDDEQPKHEVDLYYDYYLARFPVTVDQYGLFLEISGYKTNEKYNLEKPGNHPIVNVSWYNAQEYCEWLDQNLKTLSLQILQDVHDNDQLIFLQGLAEGKLRITLPSEAEWEKAARGTDGSLYPWKGEFNPSKANMIETGIGSTSAVGCFPNGASPYGILDMSGNVYEWTRSLGGNQYKPKNIIERAQNLLGGTNFKYPYVIENKRENLDAPESIMRILRGGSFKSNPDAVRCADRLANNPNVKHDNYGFRVVVAPVPFP